MHQHRSPFTITGEKTEIPGIPNPIFIFKTKEASLETAPAGGAVACKQDNQRAPPTGRSNISWYIPTHSPQQLLLCRAVEPRWALLGHLINRARRSQATTPRPAASQPTNQCLFNVYPRFIQKLLRVIERNGGGGSTALLLCYTAQYAQAMLRTGYRGVVFALCPSPSAGL
jgi:hypothetical protein